MKISVSDLKKNTGELVREIQLNRTVELTHYGNVIARVVPIAQAAASDAQTKIIAAKFAPQTSVAPKHRNPERAAAVAEFHAHTGNPLADLAEMQVRALAAKKRWPPRRFGNPYKRTDADESWYWAEWKRLREASGMDAPDNMDPESKPLPEEIAAQKEEEAGPPPVTVDRATGLKVLPAALVPALPQMPRVHVHGPHTPEYPTPPDLGSVLPGKLPKRSS